MNLNGGISVLNGVRPGMLVDEPSLCVWRKIEINSIMRALIFDDGN